MLTLTLEKPGANPAKRLQLSLNKGARFTVKVEWQCNAAHEDDVDIHALEARNSGNGARVTALESILSTYNTQKMNPKGGALLNAPDGSFATPSGGLRHSGDIRTQGNYETITIDGSKIPVDVNEIPLFATVHKADHNEEHEGGSESEEEAAFADIETCTVTIAAEGGKVLGSYRLSSEFGEFNVVQLGSVMLNDGVWEYAPVGRGFTGTINDVLAQFS
ncbi:MAG: TerD family protein [Alphaproteobacteria bacterium]|nr:TerD family protein [Alphaproteobacteria bacterium]